MARERFRGNVLKSCVLVACAKRAEGGTYTETLVVSFCSSSGIR